MRIGTALLVAAAIAATPAAAQETGGTTGMDAVNANNADPQLAGNTVDTSAGANPQLNGLAATPGTPVNATTTAPPTMGDTAAATGGQQRENRGFPWGLLGLLGLLGFLGRSRRTRTDG